MDFPGKPSSYWGTPHDQGKPHIETIEIPDFPTNPHWATNICPTKAPIARYSPADCRIAAPGIPGADSVWSNKWVMKIWLVVSTPLKNISQWEGLSHILWKIKNVPNHQPEIHGQIRVISKLRRSKLRKSFLSTITSRDIRPLRSCDQDKLWCEVKLELDAPLRTLD